MTPHNSAIRHLTFPFSRFSPTGIRVIPLALSATLLLRCGGVEPSDPTGIAVWADDCSSIACAINKSDYDGRLFMNHSTNERYDIALFDSGGTWRKTIVANRQIDGFTSSVEEIYFMKTRGYLLVKTLMYNCGGRRIEKISLDGAATQLCHISCDVTDQVSMVPSPRGTFIVKSTSGYSPTASTCSITFFDSTGLAEISSAENLETGYVSAVRWLSDSLLEVSGSSHRFALKPAESPMPLPDSVENCTNPATSSSAYCSGKGYITYSGSTQSIVFSALPVYLRWCE